MGKMTALETQRKKLTKFNKNQEASAISYQNFFNEITLISSKGLIILDFPNTVV